MKLKRYAEFKKLIITHHKPAQSCRVDKQLQIRDEKTSMNYTG